MNVTLRTVEPTDEAFLYDVYASTRSEELALVAWSETQKTTFLKMQFAAQHRYYTEHYSDTTFQIILAEEYPAGRLYVARWPDEMRIVDIALLPHYRNAGIGTALLQQLLAEAVAANKCVRIHVEQFNPALRFYERLGFAPIGEGGVYLLMEWAPSRAR